MSRSTKQNPHSLTNHSWLEREPSDEPETEKAGARRHPKLKPQSPEQNGPLMQRHTFGHTEKILRRNRKLWSRLYAKIGRRIDARAVSEGLEERG